MDIEKRNKYNYGIQNSVFKKIKTTRYILYSALIVFDYTISLPKGILKDIVGKNIDKKHKLELRLV